MADLSSPAAADGPAPRRGSRWRRIALALAATLGFLALLGILAPAGLVARLLEASAAPARLMAVDGRLYRGSGELLVTMQPLGRLSWQLRPAALLAGGWALQGTLDAPGHALQGRVGGDLAGRSLRLEGLDGRIDKASFDPLLRPYNIDVPGELVLEAVSARARRDGPVLRLEEVAGTLRWAGGRVIYELGGRLFTATLPPLVGELDAAAGIPSLRVSTAAGAPLLSLTAGADGWVRVQVRYRLLQLTGQGYADPPPADSIVLELAERLF